jgi:hypothetical protein
MGVLFYVAVHVIGLIVGFFCGVMYEMTRS